MTPPKAQALLKILCLNWAEDDTTIKRLAESVGIQGESTDDYFRSSVEVVEDMVKEIKALRAQLHI